MEVNDRLKKIIFKKLANDLSHVEVIPYNGMIWFIDRDKYWYFQLEDNGKLWWRYDFFEQFFRAFSLDRNNYEPLIVEWVEQVLNRKVESTRASAGIFYWVVENVLNSK
jgi:hypothetical protein